MDMQSEIRNIKSAKDAEDLAAVFEAEGALDGSGPAGQAAGVLLRAMLLYAGENMVESMRIDDALRQLILLENWQGGLGSLDAIFNEAERADPDSSAVYVYRFYRLGSEQTRRDALINIGAMFLRLTGVAAPRLEEPASALADVAGQAALSEDALTPERPDEPELRNKEEDEL